MTPKRYRTLGTGVSLPTADSDLLPSLTAASAMVNSYCAAPVDHDFRGGSITSEQHPWDIGNQWHMGTTKVYPYHRPIKSVGQLQIDVTNIQHVTIASNELYANKVEGWVEPVVLALTTVGMFGMTILPGVGLREPVARLDYDYGWAFSSSNEELTSVSEGTLQALNQFWLDDPVPIIKKDGAVLPNTQYSVDGTEGIVTVSSYESTAIYTADYSYPLPLPIARATAMIATDIIGQSAIAAAGLLGMSGLRVEEVELRQSSKVGLYTTPVNGAAQLLLAPYKYLNWGG